MERLCPVSRCGSICLGAVERCVTLLVSLKSRCFGLFTNGSKHHFYNFPFSCAVTSNSLQLLACVPWHAKVPLCMCVCVCVSFIRAGNKHIVQVLHARRECHIFGCAICQRTFPYQWQQHEKKNISSLNQHLREDFQQNFSGGTNFRTGLHKLPFEWPTGGCFTDILRYFKGFRNQPLRADVWMLSSREVCLERFDCTPQVSLFRNWEVNRHLKIEGDTL